MRNKKAIIAQSKNYSISRKSSSGGMFAELARYILSKGGVVFGCTMERIEDGFDVKHIYIENEEDLYKLQGSKYVQSNLKNTIKEAKEFLDKGRIVLYSGTPCQIAGLKAYLKQDYDNLLTVDLSCEGTPSLKIFNDYIKYLEKYVIKHKIIDFKFRSKKHFGWSTSGFIAVYEHDNKIAEKILPQNLSSYFTFFLNGTILQERCFNCNFTGLNRMGDVTIADAWGVDKEYTELLKTKFDKNKGISLVLMNSKKGENAIETIHKNIVINSVDVKKLRKYNHPLRHPSIKAANRNKYLSEYNLNGYKGVENLFRADLGVRYYYYLLKNHTPNFIKTIIKLFMPRNKKTDCLLMTYFCLNNYGSILTAYALKKAISNMGFNCKLIINASLNYFVNKNKKNYSLTKRCVNKSDYINLNKLSEIFVLGSDNLINLDTNGINEVAQNLFNYTFKCKKRIMISGSIGSWDGKTKNQEEHDYIKYLLDRFDYVSTREEHGKQVFENIFNVKADWINDPVFYLEKQDYIDLTKSVKQDYTNNIMEYILYPTKNTQNIVEYYKNEMNLNVVKFDGNENVRHFSRHKNKSIENWLSAIINSDLIITDSFHCAAFALIFNKPFVCIKNTRNTVRFTSLFKKLGINIPFIESVEDIETANLNYDKERVNKSLCDIREYALDKIEKALLAPKKEYIENSEMEKYNKNFIVRTIPWYKKNKLFYIGVIIPFVIPIKKLMADMKNECKKNNK